jgi:hypothetical protein
MPFRISEISPERWQQLDELFQSASESAPEVRAAFVESLGADPALQHGLELLLEADASAREFLEQPALALAFTRRKMKFSDAGLH